MSLSVVSAPHHPLSIAHVSPSDLQPNHSRRRKRVVVLPKPSLRSFSRCGVRLRRCSSHSIIQTRLMRGFGLRKLRNTVLRSVSMAYQEIYIIQFPLKETFQTDEAAANLFLFKDKVGANHEENRNQRLRR